MALHEPVVLTARQRKLGRIMRFWKTIVRTTGPAGLRPIKGFRDEALAFVHSPSPPATFRATRT